MEDPMFRLLPQRLLKPKFETEQGKYQKFTDVATLLADHLLVFQKRILYHLLHTTVGI